MRILDPIAKTVTIDVAIGTRLPQIPYTIHLYNASLKLCSSHTYQ